jgi:hypothetical protein
LEQCKKLLGFFRVPLVRGLFAQSANHV